MAFLLTFSLSVFGVVEDVSVTDEPSLVLDTKHCKYLQILTIGALYHALGKVKSVLVD